jgi:hypothetical protein
MSSECSTTSLDMPGMSEGPHAKTSAFARRKSTSTASYLGLSSEPIWTCLQASLLGSRGTDLTASVGSKLPAWHFASGTSLEALQVGDEGLGLGEGLSVLHALHVAFVRVSVCGADGDDPVGAWHLELEVRVVGDDHELGVARSPQHRVVGPLEPDHLEHEGFPMEVGGIPKADGQIELPKGEDALSGDDPVKGRHTSSDRGQIDLQEPEGQGVDNVEAVASVHEDLGKPGVADNGIDNERVLSWAQHAVGVVALVEGDGLVGTV